MGPVEGAIRKSVHDGEQLATPCEHKPFWVRRVSAEGIVLDLGEERTPTLFGWACLEGIVPFLKGRGSVRINGTGKSTAIRAGTLDSYLKGYINRLTAGWVAALLEKSGVVIIDRSRPAAHVRLVETF